MKVIPTDGELLMRFFRHHDDAAFEMLVNRHQSSVYGVCLRVLGNRHDAEDAFQATFLVLARKARTFESVASVGGWLFRVALRTARNVRFRKNRTKEESIEFEPIGSRDPLDVIQERELLTTLYDELGKLPEMYRTPIFLCLLEGRSRLEASTELDCSLASLKARLARGKQRLRLQLTRRGVAFSVAIAAASTVTFAAEPSLGALSALTVSNCTSYMFSRGGPTMVPSEILQLSERGLSAMTLATYSKVAIATLVVMLFGVGGVTIPRIGIEDVHGADKAVSITAAAAPQSTNRSATFSAAMRTSPFRLAQQVSPNRSSALDEASAAAAEPLSDMRATVKNSISEQASSNVIYALIEALDDRVPDVQYRAAQTLAAIGNRRQEVIVAFAKAAKSKDKKLRYYAIAGLGRIGAGDADAIEVLSTIITEDDDVVFRKAAVNSLAAIGMGSDKAALTLAAALKDEDATIRVAAAEMLSKLQSPNTPFGHRGILLPGALQPTRRRGNDESTYPLTAPRFR